MPQVQGNALEISLDFQFGPIPYYFFLHTPLVLWVLKVPTRVLEKRLQSLLELRRSHWFSIITVDKVCEGSGSNSDIVESR